MFLHFVKVIMSISANAAVSSCPHATTFLNRVASREIAGDFLSNTPLLSFAESYCLLNSEGGIFQTLKVTALCHSAHIL